MEYFQRVHSFKECSTGAYRLPLPPLAERADRSNAMFGYNSMFLNFWGFKKQAGAAASSQIAKADQAKPGAPAVEKSTDGSEAQLDRGQGWRRR